MKTEECVYCVIDFDMWLVLLFWGWLLRITYDMMSIITPYWNCTVYNCNFKDDEDMQFTKIVLLYEMVETKAYIHRK